MLKTYQKHPYFLALQVEEEKLGIEPILQLKLNSKDKYYTNNDGLTSG